jgi:DNA mismatch repair protein MutS
LHKLADELPLFSAALPQKVQSFANAAHSVLEERFKAINPDVLTPREALDLLYSLKAEIDDATGANEK